MLVAVAPGEAGNSVYTWTDAEGRRHLSDRPPRGIEAEQVEVRVNTYTPPANLLQEPPAVGKPVAAQPLDKVVIYTTRSCGYCNKAKRFLNDQRIPYTEHDVELSARGRADYRKLNGRGVPIILVGERRMNGYSETSLIGLLRQAGYQL